MDDPNVVTLFVGGAAGLVGKIVWDWLTKKDKGTFCNRHEQLECSVHELQKAFTAMHLTVSTDIATIKADINYIKKQLSLNGKS